MEKAAAACNSLLHWRRFSPRKTKMGSYNQIQCCSSNSMFVVSSFSKKDYLFQTKPWSNSWETTLTRRNHFNLKFWGETEIFYRSSKVKIQGIVYDGFLFPIDSWAPNVDSSVVASQLSAFSLLPYLGFLYFITKSKSAPKLTLFGFYFLLAFVGAAIPAGIYAKTCYVASLSNVDWLHGGAESLLMLTNLFIILGLREALRKV
ncbi:hypothetical protein CDL12_24804 [Handroanthus impetiginosus]|uniref:Uncharacterized protein n=1 Tax=Handroanthus impetiginosus TaxID=429701 RepID=A0A2G9GBL9_9LAMI|nr:hypothetical protein CDL12_24804 [Handroanthus impetiginosus]